MAIDYRSIGKNIRFFRAKAKLTQTQIAEQLGCSTEHYSHVENGTRHIQLEMLINVCRCLDVSLEEILRGAVDVPVHSDAEAEPQHLPYKDEFAQLLRGMSKEKAERLLGVCRDILNLPRN